VRRIELSPEGNARILIDVPRRTPTGCANPASSPLVRGVVGNTNLRAYSGVLTDPPLPDGAERKVLRRRRHGRAAAPGGRARAAAAQPAR
jgi:phospholipid/cholesterol/gamma-HCH transport system substrate-binding protein